jgi:hypothetical protein
LRRENGDANDRMTTKIIKDPGLPVEAEEVVEV